MKDVYVDGIYVCSVELTTTSIDSLDIEDALQDYPIMDVKLTVDKVQIRTDKNEYDESEPS